MGIRVPETFHEAGDLLTIASVAAEEDRPNRAWLSVPGLAAARRAADVLRDAWHVAGRAETAASAFYTPAALAADIDRAPPG